MVDQGKQRPLWLNFLLLILLPVAGLALGAALTSGLNIDQAPYAGLAINLFFLAACLAAAAIFRFSRQDLGLQLIKSQIGWHAAASLAIFALYILFYIFAIRISALKPFSSAMAWGIITAFVIAFSEELYFRGILYRFIEQRFSAQGAWIVTALVFGLFHARQGLSGMATKAVTGWLWGSVRYTSGMIFMIIFPVHFTFNAIWLMFVGNWDNLPLWGIVALPTAEFLLGLVIVTVKIRRSSLNQPESSG